MRHGVQDSASEWWSQGRWFMWRGQGSNGKEVRQVYSEENKLGYLSSNFNVMWITSNLLKCRFWVGASGMSLRICVSYQLSEDTIDACPWTIYLVVRPYERAWKGLACVPGTLMSDCQMRRHYFQVWKDVGNGHSWCSFRNKVSRFQGEGEK